MASKEMKVGRRDLLMIGPEQIKIEEGHNLRKDFGGIQELTNSIKARGLLQPLRVRRQNGNFVLIAGERRLRSVLLANKQGAQIEQVPCILADRHANEGDWTLETLLENAHRKDLNPIEEAEGFRRLFSWGWIEGKIAQEYGCSDMHVKNRLALLEASPKAQKALKDGAVSMSAVLEAIRRFPDSREEQDAAIADAIKASNGKPASTRSVRKAAADRGSSAKPRKRTLKFAVLQEFQRGVRKHIKEDLKVKERTEWEGVLRGVRIAMGVEKLPEFE